MIVRIFGSSRGRGGNTYHLLRIELPGILKWLNDTQGYGAGNDFYDTYCGKQRQRWRIRWVRMFI